MMLCMRETRSGVLLTRLARKLRKETGDNRYRARIEDERGSLRTLILISLTRPVRTSAVCVRVRTLLTTIIG